MAKAQPKLDIMDDVRVCLPEDRPHYSLILSDTVCEALLRGDVLPELREAMQTLLQWKQGNRRADL